MPVAIRTNDVLQLQTASGSTYVFSGLIRTGPGNTIQVSTVEVYRVANHPLAERETIKGEVWAWPVSNGRWVISPVGELATVTSRVELTHWCF